MSKFHLYMCCKLSRGLLLSLEIKHILLTKGFVLKRYVVSFSTKTKWRKFRNIDLVNAQLWRNVICRNVKDLESNLKDVDKAVFGELVVKDKEHDIGKTKERIQELYRYDVIKNKKYYFVYAYNFWGNDLSVLFIEVTCCTLVILEMQTIVFLF